MLGILSARSADKSTAFAPRNPQSLHATHPGELAPEEPPTLAFGRSADPAPLRGAPRVLSEVRQAFAVDPGELLEAQGQDEGHRRVPIRGPAILDQSLDLVSEPDRKFASVRRRFPRLLDEGAHEGRAIRRTLRQPELVQSLEFLGREPNSEESVD